MRLLKHFFGWLSVLVDIGCLVIVAFVVWIMYQPGGGDAAWVLVFGGPILLGIMLVATAASIVCFRSLHYKKPVDLVGTAKRHGKDTR